MPIPLSPPLELHARSTLKKGRAGSRVTFFPSRKNGTTIVCGNLMQADFCVHLEYRRNVDTYHCRPPVMRRGRVRYKADFLLTLDDGAAVYQRFLLPNDQVYGLSAEQQQVIEMMLVDQGLSFDWLTPANLPPVLSTFNMRYLYHHSFGGSRRGASKVRKYVLSLTDRQATFEALLASGATTHDISFAIFSDQLRIDFQQKLTPQTTVYGGHDGQL